jgi:TPR repeat protein
MVDSKNVLEQACTYYRQARLTEALVQAAQGPSAAAMLYTKAAQLTQRCVQIDPKYAQAQYNLGVMHEKGKGVQQDFRRAAIWYAKAAMAGDDKAQFNLGVLYFEGKGVEKSVEQAAKLYQLAEIQGHLDAQYNLGLIYESQDTCIA